jgi:hypothetical protein
MKHYEYDITLHAGDSFKQLVYFCTETAECTLEQVPGKQPQMLVDLLNERGKQGWELVQVSFGRDGVMAFWKRKVEEKKK